MRSSPLARRPECAPSTRWRGAHRWLRRLGVCCVFVWIADAALDWVVRNRAAADIVASAPASYPSLKSVESLQPDERATLGISSYTEDSCSDRLDAARNAGNELLALALFAEGRGMHSAPAAAVFYDPIVYDEGWKGTALRAWFGGRTGVIFPHDRRAVGLHERSWRGQRVPVQGCAVCHCGKVLGQVVPGLGNKNIDPATLAGMAQSFHAAAGFVALIDDDDESRRLTESADQFCDRVTEERFANQTQGMVSVSAIRSAIYAQAGLSTPDASSRASVKPPALWGYGAKRTIGHFCDGMGVGPGWLAAVELAAGQSPETVRSYLPALIKLEDSFTDLLPPGYPLEIDLARAARGRSLFEGNCSHCHGTYAKDANLVPIFVPPRFVELDEVGTDDDRLKGNTPEFFRLVACGPLADVMSIREGYRPGYLAPRLEGVWARFPYLHNASVPNLAALLSPVAERPKAFSLRDAGEVYRFDRERVGLTVPPNGSPQAARLLEQGSNGARDVYFVDRLGHSNRGHEFGVTCTETEKRDLIEYLKTL